MNKNFEHLKKILSEKFGVPLDQITLSSDLSGDFNLSSLEVNDLISLVKKEFELVIPEEHEMENIALVSDVINLIDAFSQDL